MEEENNKMDRTQCNIPRNSLDFLFSGKEECLSKSVVSIRHNPVQITRLSRLNATICRNKDDVECQSDTAVEGEMEVEFCWCSECNKEFLSREELRLHSKLHRDNAIIDIHSQNNDSSFSSQEFKLISGELSLLKSGLCCGKCEKEFKNEKRLVKHIERYDFRCKPRRFINLSNQLKDLESKRTEENALQNPMGKGISVEIDSEPRILKVLSTCGSFDIECGLNGRNSEGNLRSLDVSLSSKDIETVEGKKRSKTLSSQVDSLHAILDTHEENRSRAIGADEMVNSPTLPPKPIDFTSDVVICDYCTKPHAFKSKLREHIVICHLSVQSYRCSVCYNVFTSEVELRMHKAKHFSEKKYICSVCNENFSSRAQVISHVNDSHNPSRTCVCSACLLCFPSRAELGLHHVCHLSEKKYYCSKCGKKFIGRKWFGTHINKCQLGKNPHKCKACGKEFTRKSDLGVHSFSHDSIKRYPCHLCSKKYTQSGSLLVHFRNIHSKIKAHECGICHKRFNVRRDLLYHYAVHSDDRPFKCEQCGQCFKTKPCFNRHVRSMHGKG